MIYTLVNYNIFKQNFNNICMYNTDNNDRLEIEEKFVITSSAKFINGDIMIRFDGDYRDMQNSEIILKCKDCISQLL